MGELRIRSHPVLSVPDAPLVPFSWDGREVTGRPGEPVSSALFAAGVRVFGHHPRDGSPQGLFCANGQCSQCTVVADGLAVKACMTPVREGMEVRPLEGRPPLPPIGALPPGREVETLETECLVVGGGPAGLSAAVELGRHGVRTILVDDKDRLGGKLVLQTHKFFGSTDACHAGTRGIDIATKLEKELRSFENVKVWLSSTAVAVFSDRKAGILRDGRYLLVRPQAVLVATGARERSLLFPGNTLPGVLGAGAFQTLVNRDLVRAARRLFVVGGGNVGLIAAYHALQAGIEVVGLCEALPDCGGYKVHRDKVARLGVPILTSHTVLAASGREQVESVTVAAVDEAFRPVPGTERTFDCDTLLVAVGLEAVDEFARKAKEYGLPVWSAGDAEEIAEASAAMFTGRIRGLEVARFLGRDAGEVPPEWHRTAEVLKSRPGATVTEEIPREAEGVFPVFHCAQEIPCNPCTSVCPKHSVVIEAGDLMGLPEFSGEECSACEQCVAVCPGLAVTLVDFRKGPDEALVTLPWEFGAGEVAPGQAVTVLDTEGTILGNVAVERVRAPRFADRAALVRVRAPRDIAARIAGVRAPGGWAAEPAAEPAAAAARPDAPAVPDDEIVCRCERVPAREVRARIRAGSRDVNALKAALRCGMGACGGKGCGPLLARIFREEGIPASEVTSGTARPLFVEVPLGVFAGLFGEGGDDAPSRHATDAHEGGL